MSTELHLPRRLSALDASFLYLERPTQVLHVASTLMFDGVLDYESLIGDLRIRLGLVPRYTERVMFAPLGLAHPTWEADPEFDLRRHVQRRTLRAPGTDQQLAELSAALYSQPLHRDRPLWEIYLIDGYHGDGAQFGLPAPEGVAPPAAGAGAPARSVLFMKVHHCMIDGVSGVQLMGVLLDPSPTPPHFTAPVTHRPPPLPSAMHRLVSALSDRLATAVHQGMTAVSFAMRPRAALAELQATVDAVVHLGRQLLAGAPRTPLNGPLGLARGLAWHTVSLNQVKAAKDRLGGSVNDIVLAALSGALRRVLIDRGMMADRTELRAVVPVNIRGAHQHLKLGNQISLMVAPLPIGILDPVERLRQVRAATGMLKKGNEAAKTERLVTLLDLVPPNLHRMLSGIRGLAAPTNTICTNVPGPPISLYMQGVRVDRIVPFVPLVEPVGLAFAILSYADTLTIGLTADAALVPDLREILPHLDASFDELWAATGLPRLARGGAVLPERQRRRANSAGTTGGTVTAIPRGQSGRRTE